MSRDEKDCSFGWICFPLGLFGPFGLLIAAIVDKGRGVFRALFAMVVFYAFLFFVVYGLDQNWFRIWSN